MGTTQSKYDQQQSGSKSKTIDANSVSYGMSPMAASYADGFRLIKEKPCKHAAGFLKGNQPPRHKKIPTGTHGCGKKQTSVSNKDDSEQVEQA